MKGMNSIGVLGGLLGTVIILGGGILGNINTPKANEAARKLCNTTVTGFVECIAEGASTDDIEDYLSDITNGMCDTVEAVLPTAGVNNIYRNNAPERHNNGFTNNRSVAGFR